MALRFAVTHLHEDGSRHFSFARQGRNTYPDLASCELAIDQLKLNNDSKTLSMVFGEQALGTFAPRPCSCYDGHFDPRREVWLGEVEGLLYEEDDEFYVCVDGMQYSVCEEDDRWPRDMWPADSREKLACGEFLPVVCCPCNFADEFEICEFLPDTH